jgi:2-hydroxymuconate-semialdehyde hydrolase
VETHTPDQANPEIGESIRTGEVTTNYHDRGEGAPVLLLHGSGPGVSAWANWRLPMPILTERHRVIAPDLAGFGYSEIPEDWQFGVRTWLRQTVDLLDALDIERTSVVGNSFGGSMALALAIHHPERVDRMVLMGSVGVPFEITEGLDTVWGYQPSLETMGHLIRDVFAYDASLASEDLIRLRYEASLRPGAQESFSRMFPAPRQRWVDAMAHDEGDIRALRHPTLLVHGRDDKVIPLATTLTLLDWIEDSQAHIFGRCGHWTQIEHTEAFSRLVVDFLAG